MRNDFRDLQAALRAVYRPAFRAYTPADHALLSRWVPKGQRGGYQQRVKRQIAQQAYAINTQTTIQIPRNYDIETLYVTFTGTVGYPAALVNAAVRSDAPFGLLARVEIIAEGRQTLFNVPGYILGMMNVRRHKRPTYRERVESYSYAQSYPLAYVAPTSAMSVSTTQTYVGTICIDLQNISGYRPKDTNLRSGGLQTLDLKLTWSDLTALFYPLAAAPTATPFNPPIAAALPALTNYTITPGLVTVAVSEVQEIAGKDQTISTPTWVQRWTHQDINIPGAASNQQIIMPTDNFVTGIFGTTKIGGESVDGVLNAVRLRRGIDVRYNLLDATQRALGNVDYDYYLAPGFYAFDVISSGQSQAKITEAWNLQGGADTRVEFDSAAGSAFHQFGVTSCEMLPLKQG